MKKLAATFLFLLLSSQVNSETVTYEIYDYTKDPDGVLVAKGSKEYSTTDISIVEKNLNGEIHWTKTLALEAGYGLGASVYREPKTTGFGLWGVSNPSAFSWEWFTVSQPGKFDKLQENGQVSVKYRDLEGLEEIVEIHFDTDVSMRLNATRKVGEVTHRILIKKGSVLKFQ